jgi:penicillin-insensitive murein endopeptidase
VVALQACFAGRAVPRDSDGPPPTMVHGPPGSLDRHVDPVDADDEVGDEPMADGGDEEPGELPPAVEQAPHPFAELTDEQLEQMLLEDPASLGAVSVGRPNGGALVGGVPMPEGAYWEVVNPRETWGTPETVEALARCITRVNEQFSDTPVLPIGDISDEDGGHLVPHISHQSGRDVDVGYYYTTGDKWYTTATGDNLDLPRTWAFVKAIITETDVELIFIDRRVQKLLRDYATSIGDDESWLDEVFGGPSTNLRALIRHEPGHRSHIHVRYYSPIAQESGRRLYRALLAHKLVEPPTYYIKYKVRRGDTLKRMADKFNTSVNAIKKANRLRSNRIYAERSYRIPRRGGVTATGEIAIPERRLPPATAVTKTTPAETPAVEGTTSGDVGRSALVHDD